jgi:hypothetical protein
VATARRLLHLEETMTDAPNPIALKTVLYDLPGTADVTVVEDVVYRTEPNGPLVLDLYYPPGAATLPAVVIAAGFPDPGFERVVGCRFKDMGSSVSWARLIAASGMIAVTYTNRSPLSDLESVLAYLQSNADSLRIDADHIALWASSGNGPTALSAMSSSVTCAVLCYPYTLDVPAAAAKVGFATTTRSLDDLPSVPLFLARAGRDEMPQLNESLDRFIAGALARNLPLTVVNQPDAPHAFDLYVDSAETRRVIRQILEFLRSHLLRP